MKLIIRYEHDIPVNAFLWQPRSYKEPLHYHASLEIGCCLSGRGTFHFGGKSYPARPGDLFIVNDSELHIAESDPDDPCSFIFVNFDPGLLQKEDEELLLPFSYPSAFFRNHIPADTALAKELYPLVVRIRQELQDKRDGYRSMVRGTLLQLGTLLLREHASQLTAEARERQGSAFRELRTLLAYVEEHFKEPLDLRDLAKRMDVSPSRASRKFLEATGRSFKDFVTRLRLGEAKRLLVGTALPVTEVCFASGFQSLASFYRFFAEAEQRSPIEYRNHFAQFAINENSGD